MSLSTTHIDQLGNRSPDGEQLGQATTDLIGFYGKTPLAQRATGNNTLLTTGATTTVQTAVLIEIQATLVGLGLMPAT
jgi:hypothetical protein